MSLDIILHSLVFVQPSSTVLEKVREGETLRALGGLGGAGRVRVRGCPEGEPQPNLTSSHDLIAFFHGGTNNDGFDFLMCGHDSFFPVHNFSPSAQRPDGRC